MKFPPEICKNEPAVIQDLSSLQQQSNLIITTRYLGRRKCMNMKRAKILLFIPLNQISLSCTYILLTLGCLSVSVMLCSSRLSMSVMCLMVHSTVSQNHHRFTRERLFLWMWCAVIVRVAHACASVRMLFPSERLCSGATSSGCEFMMEVNVFSRHEQTHVFLQRLDGTQSGQKGWNTLCFSSSTSDFCDFWEITLSAYTKHTHTHTYCLK